jgi:hypothetical protein
MSGGAGGIRTLDRALQPYNGLANRRLQPLGHSSICADMPDARASRKRQIQLSQGHLGAPSLRARSSRTADIPYRALRRMFPALRGRKGTQMAQHAACATRDLTPLGSLRVFASTPRRNRVKLIRCRRRTDSIPANHGSRSRHASRRLLPHSITL